MQHTAIIKNATEDFQFSVAFLFIVLFQKLATRQELTMAGNLIIFNQQQGRPINFIERKI